LKIENSRIVIARAQPEANQHERISGLLRYARNDDKQIIAFMKKTSITIILFLLVYTAGFAQRVIPEEQLSFIKTNKNKVTNGTSAYKALISKADKELDNELIPVTEKKIVAASGDKHDYISMGPYWWPNPNTPDGLPYIKKDGQRNPETQLFDRYKLDKLAKGVITLGYAYYFTKDERYANKAMDYLDLWFLNKKTRMNPNLNYAQMVMGLNGNKGRAEGIIDAYMLVEMLDCVTLLSKSKVMKPKDLDGIKAWFSDFLDWMLNSETGQEEYRAKNNHGVAYDVQVVAYALFAGRTDVAEKFIKEFPDNRLFKQIEPDGSQPLELERTMALHYTIFNILHFMDMATLAKSTGINLFDAVSEDGRSVAKAIEFIKPYLGKPQSEFPYQQIHEWDENQNKLAWTLRRAAFFHPNEEYDRLFNQYCATKDTDIQWLLWAK
jgi:hypothetical protein